MTARFAPGDPVRVRPGAKPGHVRTPDYLKGKAGEVERVLGAFPNPEDLAYGLSGKPERVLYKVGFSQRSLWPDYEGPAEEQLYADVFEHWLEPGGEV
ncbi:MAG: Nitrile hydratase beta subunit [uncultured Rubrobacteraceae bacterium]|uniref:Nitrile hydratase beta subunit n=1 Tax=uncultured Rubrobacteraceae bacterium TaxID=349277 RepID=A0A6J4R557_9ACTN|nr:MAG: Nitrile hydratase beta subunit [uncultured Rubrobacteraceae bacterium]